MKAATTAALLLAVAAFTMTMTACAPATPASPASGGGGSSGAEPPPVSPTPEPAAPTPDPPPPEPKQWTLEAAQFGDDGGSIWLETSNRSQPFAWDAITAGNVDDVRVSVGGVALAGESRSFTSTAFEPAFEGDYSGAEWTVSAEVGPGAVVLVLTAPHQRIDRGDLSHVIIESGGNQYREGLPTVSFSEPQTPSGRRATGVVVGPGQVESVTVGDGGSGYTSPPAVELFRTGLPVYDGGVQLDVTLNGGSVASIRVLNPGSGHWLNPWNCRFVPHLGGSHCRVRMGKSVVAVELTDRGRGYRTAPTVTFTRVGSQGSGAAATAVLRGPRGNSQVENLFWGRQSLYGKELLIEIAAEE